MSEHELWNELGNLYFISGAYDQAAYAYHRSIELDGNFGRPYSNLALTYVQQGKYQEAVELYRRSLERLIDDDEKAISWNRLGNLHRHLKDYNKAVVAYQHADELSPQGAADFMEGTPGRLDSSQRPASAPQPLITGHPDTAAKPNTLEDESEQQPASILDESTTPWVPADPAQYQQDVSMSPEAASLATWREADFNDDDLDVFASPALDTDVFPLDAGDHEIGQWLPVREQEPAPELESVALLQQAPDGLLQPPSDIPMAEPARPIEMAGVATAGNGNAGDGGLNNPPGGYEVPASVTRAPQLSAESSASQMRKSAAEVTRNEDRVASPVSAHSTDVEVEDQPLTGFVVVGQTKNNVSNVPPQRSQPLAEAVAPTSQPESGEAVAGTDLQSDEEEMKELESEIAKYKRVVQINPRNSHAWDALGTLYKSCENYKEAILAYQQAINCDSSKAVYYHHLGLVYACEGHDKDAIVAFRRVIEIDPDYSLAHATLGGYYRKMGLEELAQQHIGKAMKSIFDSENEYNRACLQAICGNADQAIELLGVALKNKQTYVDWILRDPDLDFIRQDPRFKQLISDYTR